MPHLKFGKTSPMIPRVTFGVSGAYSMRCAHWTPHSEHRIWTGFVKKYAREFTPLFLQLTQRISLTWLNVYSNKIHRRDLHAHKFFKWLELRIISQPHYREWNPWSRNARRDSSVQLKCQEISDKLLKDYPSHNTILTHLKTHLSWRETVLSQVELDSHSAI